MRIADLRLLNHTQASNIDVNQDRWKIVNFQIKSHAFEVLGLQELLETWTQDVVKEIRHGDLSEGFRT